MAWAIFMVKERDLFMSCFTRFMAQTDEETTIAKLYIIIKRNKIILTFNF